MNPKDGLASMEGATCGKGAPAFAFPVSGVSIESAVTAGARNRSMFREGPSVGPVAV